MKPPRTSRRKPEPDFEMRLVGREMRPWAVPVSFLARALSAVQRLMEPTDEAPDGASDGESETRGAALLHLIGIVSRSAGYSVAAEKPEEAIAAITETGRLLREPDARDWSTERFLAIQELSGIARSLGCDIKFKKPGRGAGVLATITPDSYASLAATAFVKGESCVYGYLERVGGATDQRCALRLPDQPRKLVYCNVTTEELVRQLGQHIYRNVLVSGEVTWFRKSRRVTHILVKGFEPPKTGSVLRTLDEIYEAGGKVWDEVEDPEGLIAEMRGQ